MVHFAYVKFIIMGSKAWAKWSVWLGGLKYIPTRRALYFFLFIQMYTVSTHISIHWLKDSPSCHSIFGISQSLFISALLNFQVHFVSQSHRYTGIQITEAQRLSDYCSCIFPLKYRRTSIILFVSFHNLPPYIIFKNYIFFPTIPTI